MTMTPQRSAPTRDLPVGDGAVLESWKEIASYLRRNLRTCQRWERELGLPVHRLGCSRKARVFADALELDAWRAKMSRQPPEPERPEVPRLSLAGPKNPREIAARSTIGGWLASIVAAVAWLVRRPA